jgi:hypothetical protein
VQADRTPKPALKVVAQMFGEGEQRDTARLLGIVIVSAIVLMAAAMWASARHRYRRRAMAISPSPAASVPPPAGSW